MGNHSSWYDKEKRKVLILTFHLEYLKSNIYKCIIIDLSNLLFRKSIHISEQKGFAESDLKLNSLTLLIYFLSCKNRHLWRHHYLGAQGVIFVVSCRQYFNTSENLINEVMTVFKDGNLVDVPFLILFDKSHKLSEELEINEKLRSQLISGNYFYNIQFINFEDVKGLNELYFGIDWLCEVMKAVE